jgi:O-Antigen ligase
MLNLCELRGLQKALLFLVIVLCPIQDFFLAGTPLRTLGASPSVFPLSLLILISASLWCARGKYAVGRSVFICAAYALITTAYGFLIFGASAYGQNLVVKSIVSSVPIGLFLFAIFKLDYEDEQTLRIAVYCALALFILAFIFGNNNPFGLPALAENPVLHNTINDDVRPRGLASEASMFSITAISLGLLSVHLTKARVGRFLLALLTFSLLVLSGSKGGIFTVFLGFMAIAVVRLHAKWYQTILLIGAILPAGGGVLWVLISRFMTTDTDTINGSFATRISMIMCSVIAVAHHPLGVGLSGFLPAVQRYLPDAMSVFDSWFKLPVSFGEVSQYLISSDAVSTKTFFFDLFMRFGIPFAIAYSVFIGHLVADLNRKEKTTLLIAVVAIVIATATYIPPVGSYACAVTMGVAINEARRRQFISAGTNKS